MINFLIHDTLSCVGELYHGEITLEKDWVLPDVPPPEFVDKVGKHPYIAQYLWVRGLTDENYFKSFLNRKPNFSTDPFLFKDMEVTVNRLWGAIRDRHNITVFGDYDADGVTATSILYLALKELGAKVSWFVPNRSDGYGASVESLKKVFDLYHPDLIITVDNGIKSEESAQYCNERGVDFIVTDHHSVDYEDKYPYSAFSVVNPSQNDCKFPDNKIAGCGVAYNVVYALALWGKKTGVFNSARHGEPYAFAHQYLDLVAIGSIADMMPMTSLMTRWMVWEGIKLIRNQPRAGIIALCESGYGLDWTRVNAVDIAFSIAPQINASGRMDDPSHAVKMLISEDVYRARPYAEKISLLNKSRKDLQREVTDKVFENLSNQDTSIKSMPVIIQKIDCPHGVVGLVAGDVSRKYNRPAIMMCEHTTHDQVALTGSARSVEGMNIVQVLKGAHDYMIRYGGHAGAAGMTVASENYDKFKDAMFEAALREIAFDEIKSGIKPDIVVGLHQLNDVLFDIQELLEPLIGSDAPPVSYYTEQVTVLDYSVWGNNHLKMRVTDGNGNIFKVNGWGKGEGLDPENEFKKPIDIIYAYENATIPYNHTRLALIEWRYSDWYNEPKSVNIGSITAFRDKLNAQNKIRRLS